MHQNIKYSLIAVFYILLLLQCEKPRELSPKEKAYIAEVEAWHKGRIERLTSKTGWLSLVGLYWLKEGVNTFGGDTSNNIMKAKLVFLMILRFLG